MIYIIAQLQDKVGFLREQVAALTQEREAFHANYRMKCDKETKALHIQLAVAQAEIELLRTKVAALRNTMLIHDKQFDQRDAALDAAQARIVELREAWDDLLEDLELNGMHSFDPYRKSKAWFKKLATPDDTAALDARLAQERERCAKACESIEKDIVCPEECAAAIRSMK